VICYGVDGKFGSIVGQIYEDTAGTLWVGDMTRLWRSEKGVPKCYAMPNRPVGLPGLPNGATLVIGNGGMKPVSARKAYDYKLPNRYLQHSTWILQDREDNLWIGSQNAGIVHVHNGRPDGLSSEFLSTFFEDAKEDIWIASSDCLDRFREVAVPTVSVKQGLFGREFKVPGARRRAQARRRRGLHDTLPQSFQGALIVRGVRNLFARRPEGAMHTLDGAIGSSEWAITEGRDGVQNLRTGSVTPGDLAHLLRATGKELPGPRSVRATTRTLASPMKARRKTGRPVIQDELYRIGRDVLRNAFHHARAMRIEVEVLYGARAFRLRIRDNGIGIGQKVLVQDARLGNWGSPGVRERAKPVGVKLNSWSEAGAGAEVQVTVPAAIAYEKSRAVRASRFFQSYAD
jgi:hypothetical protein